MGAIGKEGRVGNGKDIFGEGNKEFKENERVRGRDDNRMRGEMMP